MSRMVNASAERGEKFRAFAASLCAGGDPRAARLMDEMRRVSHHLYQLGEASLASAGLSYAQYRILMVLLFHEWLGDEQGLNPSTISAEQGTSRNTISALIRSLEEAGLIERHLDAEDRRRFNIRLTEAGRIQVSEHANRHICTIADIFAALTPEEMATLSTLLQKLYDRAQVVKEEITTNPGGSYATSR